MAAAPLSITERKYRYLRGKSFDYSCAYLIEQAPGEDPPLATDVNCSSDRKTRTCWKNGIYQAMMGFIPEATRALWRMTDTTIHLTRAQNLHWTGPVSDVVPEAFLRGIPSPHLLCLLRYVHLLSVVRVLHLEEAWNSFAFTLHSITSSIFSLPTHFHSVFDPSQMGLSIKVTNDGGAVLYGVFIAPLEIKKIEQPTVELLSAIHNIPRDTCKPISRSYWVALYADGAEKHLVRGRPLSFDKSNSMMRVE